MYRILPEPKKIKKPKIVKNHTSKQQKQINMIKNLKMNPILKSIYLSNYR